MRLIDLLSESDIICSRNKVVYVKEGFSVKHDYDLEEVENECLQELNFLKTHDELFLFD